MAQTPERQAGHLDGVQRVWPIHRLRRRETEGREDEVKPDQQRIDFDNPSGQRRSSELRYRHRRAIEQLQLPTPLASDTQHD